ncbi:MAG: recombination mediator RecR [Rikenellaceae bacterium]
MKSELLTRVVEELSKLPSVGERSALRLALHLLRQPESTSVALASAIENFRKNIKYCVRCNNISDSSICPICSDQSRDNSIICVVEQVKDVISIESTGGYNGLYHVLGGVISPMQGISPSMLKIDLLAENISKGVVKEVIIALPSSVEGDTTVYFIRRKIEQYGVKISVIARGIGVGEGLDLTDELTLVHALNNRIPIK